MTYKILHKLPSAMLSTAIIVASASITLAASTDWQDLGGGKARLSAIKDPITSKIEGFVEIQLDEGWKTYWRSPGDAGIPPTLNFSNSTALELGEIKFPKPKVIEIPDASYMGYEGNVKFTFSGKAMSDITDMKLEFFAGVCEEICIPAMANFEISAQDFNVSDPKTKTMLVLAKSKHPKTATDTFGIAKFNLSAEMVLNFEAALPESSSGSIFLLEGPLEWFSGPIKSANNRFSVQFDKNLMLEENWQSKFRYTLINGNKAVEAMLSDVKQVSKN